MVRAIATLLLAGVWSQAPAAESATDPAYPLLSQAYEALHSQDYETAIRAFQRATKIAPDRSSIRKDLAYTLLKIGENEAAREEFAEAMRIDPNDYHVALEYGFLCYETKEQVEARRVFNRLRKVADQESRRTAEKAFENIDRPLREGIERWSKVVARHPENFSAQKQLAQLADRRDDWKLAASHYEAAWRIRPKKRRLLLDLGRVWGELNRPEKSMAALLAASRGAEPRTAEKARALLPERYPYVSEFERALRMDPKNTRLRREFAYLLLKMNRSAEAEREFGTIVDQAPDDLLSAAQLGFLRLNRKDYQGARPLLDQVMKSDDKVLAERVRKALGVSQTQQRDEGATPAETAVEPKAMAAKSFEAGYLDDAAKYLRIAHNADPTDFQVMLELGKTQNVRKKDSEAIEWFDLARRSPDPKIAKEAERSYHNLERSFSRFSTTFWLMPFYSSRWENLFGYAQLKTEVRFGKVPVRPYVSVRFAGDARQTIGSVSPRYLSESSFVFGVGLRTLSWNGLMGWIEAGSDVSYLDHNDGSGRMAPDYRGGVSFARGFGDLLGGEASGAFAETYDNGVFMSRFNNTFLGSSQNRFGYTPPVAAGFGDLESQLYWNGNVTVDAKQQHWANFVEFGPGVRFRWKALPKSMVFSVDLLRGVYLLKNSPRGPNFNDVRVGMWYAFTK